MQRKKQKKRSRKKFPKHVKNTVWNMYIGADKAEGRCYVCNKTIHMQNFEVGHNIAKSKGGSDRIDNLRPICRGCNLSMGTMSIDVFKRKYFPKSIKRVSKEMPLEEKLVELEKRTGYYPTMVLDEAEQIHVFYGTTSQTIKELQHEIIVILERIWDLFPEKKKVILTTNKIHDPRGTVGETDPEIITVCSVREEFKEYQQKRMDKRKLWNELVFFRKISIDQFHKIRTKFVWSLVV